MSGADDEEAEVLARRELATQLARIATEVGARCEHARGAWQTRAAPVVARRETREQARAWLRLCMRAWREQTDGARAHAGRWERRWAHAGAGGDCALAARVRMPAGCAVLWEEEGWRVRVLLEWQRLVNGGRVMAKRSGTVGVMGAHLRRPSEDAERDAQHVQPDAHEAGASGSCDAVTLDMTEASPRSQVPAVETCINPSAHTNMAILEAGHRPGKCALAYASLCPKTSILGLSNAPLRSVSGYTHAIQHVHQVLYGGMTPSQRDIPPPT